MLLSELIRQAKEAQKIHGDIEVRARDILGIFCPVEELLIEKKGAETVIEIES